ncbi:MAG: type II toxin-antitoxin system RelE/ParE family toxin [Candidatus Aminicenantes bacterium]|nr:type II toxin-antitoxin system RelE/ParE family toxin [Candidatus Aminicenantes bacterium]
MASYKVGFRASAEKELRKLPAPDLVRIIGRISDLAGNPRPEGVSKLSGEERYRIRQGDYRIVYAIDDREKAVLIVKIGNRKDVYR